MHLAMDFISAQKQVSMTMECQKVSAQTNPRYHMKKAKNIDAHTGHSPIKTCHEIVWKRL